MELHQKSIVLFLYIPPWFTDGRSISHPEYTLQYTERGENRTRVCKEDHAFLLSLELAPPFPQIHFPATNREERL